MNNFVHLPKIQANAVTCRFPFEMDSHRMGKMKNRWEGKDEMEEINYSITLQAPIGKRSGEMTFWMESGTVKGQLHLLQKMMEFEGNVEADGSLAVTGELITLMRKVPYFAEGRMSRDTIRMTLHAGHSTYELTGNKKGKEGESA